MKRRFVILILCLLTAVMLSACSADDGTLTVKDSSGNDRLIVADENGAPVYDEAGNVMLIETDADGRAQTDSDGNYITNPLAMNYIISVDDMIYCRYFSLKEPSGYEFSSSGSNVRLSKRDGSNILLSYDAGASMQDKLESAQTMYAAAGQIQDAQVDLQRTEKELCGESAVILRSQITRSTDGEQTDILNFFCVFEKNGVAYTVIFQTEDVEEDFTETEAIIESISFR